MRKDLDNKLIYETLQEGGMRQPVRLDRARVNEDGGASAQEMNAWRQVVDGLRSGRIDLKEVEQGAGTIVVSTGDEKSVILKVIGFEGDHDIPVSLRSSKLDSFKKAILDLEPARDVRELYQDALEAGIDAKTLHKIIVNAVHEGDLNAHEAYLITDGAIGEQDPSDVGHRGYDKPGL